MGTNTFKLHVTGITKTTSIDVVEDIKFTVQFELKANYKGEFGFDWMRDDYSNGISLNYEDLKKEYKETQINDQDYFVPYLSMFPNQEGVILNLKLDILQGKARKDDIIKLPAIDGIKFDPEEVKVKDLEKEQVEVKVICESVLSQDTSIELLDKNDNPVGEIIVVKNDEVYDLEIKFVKVCWERHLDKLKEKFNRTITDLESFMANNSLNQALIKPKIVEKNYNNIEYIKIDDLPEDLLTGGSFLNSKGRRELKKISESARNFKGIVIFYLGLEHQNIKAGDAQTFPLDDQFVFLYLNSSYSRDLSHEIGHTLGLSHTFPEDSTMGTRLEATLDNYEGQLTRQRATLGDESYDQEQVNANVSKLESMIEIQKQSIEDYNSVGRNNSHKFEEGKTTNLMDYSSPEKTLDFFQWQWKIMQKEVIKYYN
ncbi:hypothetical protein [uncultured Aquimarina sp.]|uniref:hypothetical protein n=1 Tax=uncultured Aquimarina sp. TaxID=575652 RepID=UPI0026235B29|nr:hypothetical protein [uncultured Aquimarina sp.]